MLKTIGMETPAYDVSEEFHTEEIMSWNHATVTYRLTKNLSKYDDRFSIQPEMELELSHGRAKPDISVYPLRKTNWLKDIIRVTEPPLLAIEILSPRQALTDLTDKAIDVLLPSGVPTVWIIIPQFKQLTVITSDQQQAIYTSGEVHDPVTNLTIDLASIFD